MLTLFDFICTTVGLRLLSTLSVVSPKRLSLVKYVKIVCYGYGVCCLFKPQSTVQISRLLTGHETGDGALRRLIESICFQKFLSAKFLTAFITMCILILITGMTEISFHLFGTMFASANMLCN